MAQRRSGRGKKSVRRGPEREFATSRTDGAGGARER